MQTKANNLSTYSRKLANNLITKLFKKLQYPAKNYSNKHPLNPDNLQTKTEKKNTKFPIQFNKIQKNSHFVTKFPHIFCHSKKIFSISEIIKKIHKKHWINKSIKKSATWSTAWYKLKSGNYNPIFPIVIDWKIFFFDVFNWNLLGKYFLGEF